ncbi:MAG: SurA N-terminal domain-containing protein, partial [Bradymonadaceae bacterium]
MLEQVRNRMQSGYTYVLIAFLIVIFMFFFGMPTRGCGKSVGPGQVELATYDGETVYNTDVSLIYNRFFGDQQGRDKQKFYRQQARSLRSYLLVKLFADRARQAGLRVGPKEFKTYMTDPMRNIEFRYFYGRDGKWNGKYYQAYVRNQLRTQIEDYEKFKREELLARKYLALHNLSVAPFPQELSDTHAFKNTKINLSYVALDPASLRQKVEVTDEEISSFRKKSADEIQSYYKKHSKEYQKPAKVRIRRVYIPRSGDGGDAESRWKQAKKRVLEN